MAQNLLGLLKDILFPVTCLACGRHGEWCCATCLASFAPLTVQHCPLCSKPTPNGQVCAECLPSSYLDGVTALYAYDEQATLAKFIKTLKYQFAHDLDKNLADFFKHIGKEAWEHLLRDGAPVCVPVPLHPRRERERGFNQAELLARALVEAWGSDVEEATAKILSNNQFIRNRHTPAQAKLSGRERRVNLANAFSWEGSVPPPDRIVIVDDVFTTGSTMQECAHELKLHGAKWVWGVALARG